MIAVDELQFHACYDTLPIPLLLWTEGRWLTNPAAEDLGLSQAELELLTRWNGSTSLWLSGQFFCVQGQRTEDGLFLFLHPDAFFSSSTMKLSGQLRQQAALAFSGLSAAFEHLSGPRGPVKEDLSAVNRALFQIFRTAADLDRCAASEITCSKAYLDLNEWFRHFADETAQWCAPIEEPALHFEGPGAPLLTMADPNLLDCLLAHLLSNAIKAAGSPGRIAVSLKKQGEQAVLTVRGSGVSFSPALLTDPAWNQPISLLPKRGLGLGLPIAQRIAALHDGALVITPTKDGSQVVFSLPLFLPEGYLASPAPRFEETGGFSQIRVILSDALPNAAFHPDFHPENRGK